MGSGASQSSIEPVLVGAARGLCEQADERGVAVRLLGGIAIWLRASEPARRLLGREYNDVDLATTKREAKRLRELLEELGYTPDKMFNALQGDRRLYYNAPDGSYHLDVFIERFVMSHELDLGRRLTLEPLTLPAAELLLTKLQIAQLNRKDASDTALLLADHELSDSDGHSRLNLTQMSTVCSENWGLYTTVTDNLLATHALLPELVPEDGLREAVAQRLTRLREELEAAPKSGAWRRRAKIGRRKRWYQTPDEV
jgi:8-oxo-dGTP pyrophosphatase MutT (NUDIX family)